MAPVSLWLRAFTLTCAVEVPVIFGLFRSFLPAHRRLPAAVMAQMLTHPAVWFILPPLGLPRPLFLAVAEGWAWLAEAAFYRLVEPTLPLRRALSASALANALSWGVGTLLQDFFR